MHEINNPLATILACCEALMLRTEDLAPGDRQGYDEYLKIIDTEVQRCRRIVESLLDFSRPKGGDKKPTDVNGVVERTLFLLKHHARFKRLRSEEHTSELQSRPHLVCRLLLATKH